MITFNYLGNQARNTEALVNIVLAVFRSENLVKIVYFSAAKPLVCLGHLFQLAFVVVCVMNYLDLIIAIDLYLTR